MRLPGSIVLCNVSEPAPFDGIDGVETSGADVIRLQNGIDDCRQIRSFCRESYPLWAAVLYE